MRVWVPLAERRRLKRLGLSIKRANYPTPAYAKTKLKLCAGTELSKRSIESYYNLLCIEIKEREHIQWEKSHFLKE